MIDIYNWDTNILDIRDKYGNHYKLELRGNKNIVKGCSGSGKSFLCEMIDRIKDGANTNAKYNASNIILLNRDNIDKLPEYKNKFIIIDKAELLLNDNNIEFINTDDNNRYLIFSRTPLGIELSPNHHADLLTENGMTTMQYRFNVKGWC